MNNYKAEQEKQDKEFGDRFGDTFHYCCDDKTLLPAIKSHLLSRDTALLEAMMKDVEEMEKDCPHDSNSHCMEEMCWIHEDGGYNQAIQDIFSLLKDYNLNK